MLQPDDTRLSRSWLDEALASFNASNDPLVIPTRSLLARFVSDDALHCRLLNTLSLLEHIGSHKIMATQHSNAIEQATLRHVAEEAHHAFFMKRQAEKTAGRPMQFVDEDLLAPATARMYFQRLEAAMLRSLSSQQSSKATYLYMSMIVEFRALWFYGLYEQTLKRLRHPVSLKRVIGEEKAHLAEMAGRLEEAAELSDARVDTFLTVERKLYERMLGALQRRTAGEV